jgi:hypothetical protein
MTNRHHPTGEPQPTNRPPARTQTDAENREIAVGPLTVDVLEQRHHLLHTPHLAGDFGRGVGLGGPTKPIKYTTPRSVTTLTRVGSKSGSGSGIARL